MKKFFAFMLVMFVAAAAANAQLVYDYTASTVTLSNGYVYAVADIPGAAYARPGDNLMTVVNNYFMRLRRNNPEEYARQYNIFMMKGGMAGVQPIGTATINGMVGGMAVGGGMVGGAVMGTGMVYGTGGMAGGASHVNITNGNMVSTIGSGVTAVYDSNTKTINVSGDPLMAVGRVVSAVTSGVQQAKANKAAKRAAAQQGQQQVQVIYVDSATGQQVAAPKQAQPVQVQTRTVQQAQPVQAQPVQATNGQVVNLYNGL